MDLFEQCLQDKNFERKTLAHLNDQFLDIIENVHYMEAEYSALTHDLNLLRTGVQSDSTGINEIFEAEIRNIRIGTENILRDRQHLVNEQNDLARQTREAEQQWRKAAKEALGVPAAVDNEFKRLSDIEAENNLILRRIKYIEDKNRVIKQNNGRIYEQINLMRIRKDQAVSLHQEYILRRNELHVSIKNMEEDNKKIIMNEHKYFTRDRTVDRHSFRDQLRAAIAEIRANYEFRQARDEEETRRRLKVEVERLNNDYRVDNTWVHLREQLVIVKNNCAELQQQVSNVELRNLNLTQKIELLRMEINDNHQTFEITLELKIQETDKLKENCKSITLELEKLCDLNIDLRNEIARYRELLDGSSARTTDPSNIIRTTPGPGYSGNLGNSGNSGYHGNSGYPGNSGCPGNSGYPPRDSGNSSRFSPPPPVPPLRPQPSFDDHVHSEYKETTSQTVAETIVGLHDSGKRMFDSNVWSHYTPTAPHAPPLSGQRTVYEEPTSHVPYPVPVRDPSPLPPPRTSDYDRVHTPIAPSPVVPALPVLPPVSPLPSVGGRSSLYDKVTYERFERRETSTSGQYSEGYQPYAPAPPPISTIPPIPEYPTGSITTTHHIHTDRSNYGNHKQINSDSSTIYTNVQVGRDSPALPTTVPTFAPPLNSGTVENLSSSDSVDEDNFQRFTRWYKGRVKISDVTPDYVQIVNRSGKKGAAIGGFRIIHEYGHKSVFVDLPAGFVLPPKESLKIYARNSTHEYGSVVAEIDRFDTSIHTNTSIRNTNNEVKSWFVYTSNTEIGDHHH